MAEAKALLYAISLGESSGHPTIIKSDCLNLVMALRDFRIAWPWDCAAWLSTMRNTLNRCPWISIAFVPRRLNKAADWIAKAARDNSLPTNWISCSYLSYLCIRPLAFDDE
ncbi:hypothetical protein LINPERHAP1_LOCUS2413 [Linum perenne]